MAEILQSLVSIVTPVYNAADFLADTIRSVQEQTHENWELIFIDDVSTDDSVNLIKEAQKKDKRIKLIQLKKNSGAANARNQGTKNIKGDFLAFLDADDLWVNVKIERQLQFANRKESSGFIFSSYCFANHQGKPITGPVSIPEKIDYEASLKNHIIWTSTVLIDLSKIPRELALMPNVRRGQDAATWWRILRQTGLSAEGMQEPLALYRRSNSTLSANKLKAVKRTWYLYRHVEKLSLMKSSYNFCFYGFNAVKKRI